MATTRIDKNERRGNRPAPNTEAAQVRNETANTADSQVTEEDYNKIIKYMIKSYDLFKKQSKGDSLIQEGKVSALEDMKRVIIYGIKSRFLDKERKKKTFKSDEKAMEKFSIDKIGPQFKELYTIYTFLTGSITKEREELVVLQATERLMERMDSELENSLVELSMLEEARNRADNIYPIDVKVRIDNNLCGLKRPGGKKPFPCDSQPVEGTKYCKEHLKKYEPLKYAEMFENSEDKE